MCLLVCPEKYNTDEAQDTDFKIVLMNVFKNLKKDVDKSNNEIRSIKNSKTLGSKTKTQ